MKTPITIITGSLGSGKTTLVQKILENAANAEKKIAILMNEFGELAIDSKVIRGDNVEIAEIDGGCVCCSMLREFEAAVEEIIDKVAPEWIVVETTGVAEPEALLCTIEDSLPKLSIDSVITLADAGSMIRFPYLGITTKMQLEKADVIIINKIDLVEPKQIEDIERKIRGINSRALMLKSFHCNLDMDFLFGLYAKTKISTEVRPHEIDWESISFSTKLILNEKKFAMFANELPETIYRAKGFIQCGSTSFLFNYVAGRWNLEPFPIKKTELVFIGKELKPIESKIIEKLRSCIVSQPPQPGSSGTGKG